MPESIVQKKAVAFAVDIIILYKAMQMQREYIISKQILKSGTGIGANIEEALAGYSKKEFASKMSIACKEARETRYWLILLDEVKLVEYNYNKLIMTSDELVKMLTSIVKSAQQNIK